MTIDTPSAPLAIPFVVDGAGPALDRLRADRTALRDRLTEHGAVLLRGFDVGGTDGFESCVRAISGELLTYVEQSSPRTRIKGNVYTSTEYPQHAEIPLHNEMSYQAIWPLTLFFHCVEPPQTQGATPLSSTRRVYELIDPAVRAEFERRRWMVVRNYGEDIGLRWWTAFGTEDRREVERLCAAGGVEPEWREGNALRTTAVRDVVHRHPKTGVPLWFNHIVLFHESSLAPTVREGLLDIYGCDGLPNNTYYGDGAPIPDEVVAHLRQCYRDASTRFDYRRDDLLIVDNMATAHGREPFTGPRRIAVAMSEASNGG
ncbi:TauD/TfdA family dioxygenase [Nocardia alba]|uniref:Alpha-ketoglutarate-dependent taurine dioxygenase n=1 Tax=Nocardia alba TaxID=225051 RepID=A0A4V2PAV1_9NOCA|nr:TauD/TfdA family dioxygenase [Nocardia alba]TCJ94955.1 alpha-ketoglutarate-dependent taurine dioxygenase [Nocardia alba]